MDATTKWSPVVNQNTDKHQTEKGRDREYVKDRRHYKIWHENKQQNHTYNREVKVFLEQSSQLVKFKVGHGQISNYLSTAIKWVKYTSHGIKHKRIPVPRFDNSFS